MLNQTAELGGGLDRVFHALADPSRRLIVERLSHGPASVSEVARPLDMSLSAVLQHLQVLETSGLVRSEKIGRVRTCQIEPRALRMVEQWIADRRSIWERRFDRLGEVLAEELAGKPAQDSAQEPAQHSAQDSAQEPAQHSAQDSAQEPAREQAGEANDREPE
jgi:DNA-binding transcriptional ArsR family regulator